MQAGEPCAARRAAGFTYVAVLLLVATLSLGLAVAGPRWADAQQREREDELLRVGRLYAQAIRSYHAASPGSVKQYPPSVESLLLDPRFIGTRRHLRARYTDPLRPGHPLEPVTGPDGTLRGVRSASERAPLRRAPLRLEGLAEIPAAARYNQWAFVAQPAP